MRVSATHNDCSRNTQWTARRRRVPTWLAVLSLVCAAVVTPPAEAGFAGTEVFLPSVGSAPGVAPAVWYTTVWVHNPGITRADVTFYLLERTANLSPRTFTDSIPAGDTKRYDNAVETLFGVQTFGALRITSNVRVVVGSRIYSQPGAALEDSTGQYFAAVPASFSIGVGESTEVIGGWQTQPAAGSAFRFNYGVVETTGSGTCQVLVTVKGASGTTLGSRSYALRQWEQLQKGLRDEFPSISSENIRLTVAVTSGSGRVIAFGSSVANGMQDPSTLEMAYADSLLAENSSSEGISGVTAGAGLTGGGSSGTVTLAVGAGQGIQVGADTVALADSGVTKPKLSAPGGTSGQLLSTNGSSLQWIDPPSGSGSGDITAVTAGAGLSGGGTTGDVSLSVANGGITGGMIADGTVATADLANAAVTTTKLSPAGGASGKVLKIDGAAVVWGEDRQLLLPYQVVVDTAGSSAFSVTETGFENPNPAIKGTSNYNTGVSGQGGVCGVYGASTASEGSLGGQYGAWGRHSASGNTGSLATSQQGVYGENGSTSAKGSFGSHDYGVYGAQHGGTRAGYFNGDVQVNGTLTKSGGSFRIDHPLDPENRYLSHSFVESPDMMNIYNGNVTTNDDGFATVTLPDWFEALNRDFRYQLTVIGGGDQWALARVSRTIEGNSFVIQTSVPTTAVSWQVTGIRRDPWAEQHRIPVEEMKPGHLRGTYLSPDLFGQPEELGESWRAEQAAGKDSSGTRNE